MFKERETEIELVEGCIRNDRKAQKKLYYKYCNAMYTIALRILKNEDDADDALQEAFIQVFKDINTFRRESTIGAWIKTIVIRSALRKLKKNVFIEEINDNTLNIPDQQSCALTGEYIEKTILSLPPGYRTVFLLIEVEGYSHKEVAEMLKISEGTSKSQLFYAKRHLRALLKELVY
jgi:RNA polymerase sigma-70 factor (ECF subfamily)